MIIPDNLKGLGINGGLLGLNLSKREEELDEEYEDNYDDDWEEEVEEDEEQEF